MMTLFGYGKTTRAIAQKFHNCKIYDDSFTEVTKDAFGNELIPSKLFDPDKSGLEVTSPGIPPSNPLIKKAQNLISEYDLFADTMPYSIWVSGTNGKTTTTEMIQSLLSKRGSVEGGNIGTPLALLSKEAPIWILETSSFSLHYTNKAAPDMYVLLPISPDHISWHGSYEAYEKAKLKPLDTMWEGEIAIIPEKYKDYPTEAMKITYNSAQDLADYFKLDIKKIKFKEPFLTDALVAMGVNKILYDEVDYDAINSFEIGKHRLEELFDKKHRLWVNDSKATSANASIAALKNYKDKKINLILGGDDKKADLTPLFELLKNLDVEIFAIGSNTQKIVELSNKIHKKVHACDILNIAVEKINVIHTNKDVAILSPAAASLDQFTSYEHRGEDFVEAIKNLRIS